MTKDSNYTPNLIDGDEIIVRVVDNDAVFMRGTIQGKTLYGTSVPLRVENYLKRQGGIIDAALLLSGRVDRRGQK